MKKIYLFLLLMLACLSSKPQGIDTLEYSTGRLSAQQQLLSYPLPRYKPNHNLNRNFIWFGLEYFSDLFQTGTNNQQAVVKSKTNNVEFYTNWNYYFMVSSNIGANSSRYNDTINYFNGAWVNMAKRNPIWKTSAICFWPQIGGNASSKTLSLNHYVRNSSGQFLDMNGNVTSNRYWSPVAPNSSIIADGQKQRGFLNTLNSNLGRQVTILNENGEILPLMSVNGNVINNDPNVKSNYLSLGYPATLNTTSTYDYAGRKFSDQTKLYREQIITQGTTTIFTHYGLDGQSNFRPVWSRARSINSQINGRYYSTGDLYPRWPNNWKGWMGPWHGLGWFADCKWWEESAGDSLNSPFVCAGWNIDETQNVRPAQYLALLKILSNWGAEFFYSGYFSLSSPFPNAKNWGYQAVMPVYAQAITSRSEQFLKNGYSLQGDVPGNFLGLTINQSRPKYLFRTDDNRKMVAIRKLYTSDKYLITTAQMVDANTMNNAPNISYSTFKLGSDSLRVEFRRQGSVYYYDKTGNIFYQLDKWHQREHPERWSRDIEIEAEVCDSISNANLISYNIIRTGSRVDLTNVTTVVNLTPTSNVWYSFNSRECYKRNASSVNHNISVRARNKNVGTNSTLQLNINNSFGLSIPQVRDTSWKWYNLNFWFTDKNNTIRLSTTGNIEIDRILISPVATVVAKESDNENYETLKISDVVNPELVIYPKISTENINVNISVNEDLKGRLVITDVTGKEIYNQDVEVMSNIKNTINIPVYDFPKGNYMVYFYYDKGLCFDRFIK